MAEVAEVEQVEQVEDVISDIQIGPKVHKLRETEIKKGKGKGNILYLIEVDLSKPDAFKDIVESVGLANWNRTVYAQVVRQACKDATHDAMKDGEVADVDWAREFIEQFVQDNRRSKVGVKQLREKQAELFQEVQPLMLKQAHGEKLTPEQNNRLLELLAQFGELNAKLEDLGKKGKARKQKKEAVAA